MANKTGAYITANKQRVLLLVLLLVLILENRAQAYIGPGAGFAVLGSRYGLGGHWPGARRSGLWCWVWMVWTPN